MCAHQKKNRRVFYFLSRLQKERAHGRGSLTHLQGRLCEMEPVALLDFGGAFVYPAHLQSHVTARLCAAFPQTPRTCVLDTTNDSGFNSSISQLFLLTPSRWCHHVVPLFDGVSYRRLFMFLSRTGHIQQNSFLSSLERLFFPHFWNITPESIYTFKFSQFLSYHLFGIIFTVNIFRKKAQIVIVYI